MRRHILLLATILVATSVLNIALMARDGPPSEPKEPPWLVKLNVMGDGLFSPQRFKLAVGDYIELTASLPPQGNQVQVFPMEHKLEGDAVVVVTPLQPGKLAVFGGNQDAMNFGFQPMNEAGALLGPVVLLRATKVGKCTLSTIVDRGEKWKELREFEIDVTPDRQNQEPVPWPKSGLHSPFRPGHGMGMM